MTFLQILQDFFGDLRKKRRIFFKIHPNNKLLINQALFSQKIIDKRTLRWYNFLKP